MTGLNGGQCDEQVTGKAVNLDKPSPEGATPRNDRRVCMFWLYLSLNRSQSLVFHGVVALN